ncbi:MAG TPA: polyprenyl synthetase family protein [Mycobacterium sp.]|jgi:geranylgeranyl diphosphate synthase type I|nr:polyprenyl synthetase family protein [Mycobacterium sp.]
MALRGTVQAIIDDFVALRCAPELHAAGIGVASEVLRDFVAGGKCVRSTYMYLGWLCGADDDGAALRAAASLELLHAFALLQDDVMDGSALRRGRPSGHVAFARWHRHLGLSGSPDRFGESAAVLLGDLCLVWAAQMMRESGMPAAALDRVWPRYDAMRTELAMGQFADLINDARGFPSLDKVLDVSRRKSGNYTVRRPLEMGAAMAGCGEHALKMLAGYGDALGEAFQMRDDVLGIFGSPAVTGKPIGSDLVERKATTVVAAAYHLAGSSLRRQLRDMMGADDLDESDLRRWADLILATGAVDWIERLIDSRLSRALSLVDDCEVRPAVAQALADMAVACVERSA